MTALGLAVIVGGTVLTSVFLVKAIHYNFFKVFSVHAKSPSLSKTFYTVGAFASSMIPCLGIAFEYQIGAMRSCYHTAQRATNVCKKAYFEWCLGEEKLQLYHQFKFLKTPYNQKKSSKQ